MRTEVKQEIKEAIGSLKINQRKAFILVYYQELSIKEVASVMKISPKAAESLLFRARKNLQKMLSQKTN
jgi:RNA polymerase sigma-70 factor (ECF subfamily)